MVLYSQSPRSESSCRQSESVASRIKRWLWVSATILGIGLAGLYLWRNNQTAAARVTLSQVLAQMPQSKVNNVTTTRPLQTATPELVVMIEATVAPVPTSVSPDPLEYTQTSKPSATRLTKSTLTATESAPDHGPSDVAVRQGMELLAQGQSVQGRRLLSQLLVDERRRLTPADAHAIRQSLGEVNQRLVFSRQLVPDDPLSEPYQVHSGDYLARIAPKQKLTYQFLERINNIKARNLRAGQTIKLIKGPFHVRVIKHDYRMDVYLRDTDGTPLYVCSFAVGIGQDNSTPEGMWRVGPRKAVNPDWRNPRTNQYFSADDPKNPLGEYWIPLQGTDEQTKLLAGYGIHGTIEPDSIGTQASMGCIRLRANDIADVYTLLVSGQSTVQIDP